MARDFLFIVNPISGHGAGKGLPRRLSRHPRYAGIHSVVRFTKHAGHARELAEQAAAEGFTHVVAVGGDGTVNEVGSALRGTGIIMGIIPLGSGNGLARHLGYSTRVDSALTQLLDGTPEWMDIIEINGHSSLNVSGLGFDAATAHLFAGGGSRGLFAYVRAAVRLWFCYKEREYTFRVGEETWSERGFIVSLANGSQYGYNFVIAPGASTRDGLLDLCVLRRPRLVEIPLYLLRVATRRVEKLPHFHRVPCREVTILDAAPEGHVDGDPCFFTSPVHARVIAAGLRVALPVTPSRTC
ncbi:MAG: diacylglycerol kinase family lipid kinase [Odoribacteraceae bacterium]|jgi:diacylglycerol kinase family enzyme|nr:diacylglycerol kinase family lipid kinase [Odoribacteraceae bacterium]